MGLNFYVRGSPPRNVSREATRAQALSLKCPTRLQRSVGKSARQEFVIWLFIGEKSTGINHAEIVLLSQPAPPPPPPSPVVVYPGIEVGVRRFPQLSIQ